MIVAGKIVGNKLTNRDKGIDAARGLALVGMVIVHLQTDFFSLEKMDFESPYWDFILSVFSNRARPMFFLLAGFAAATVITTKAQHFMLRRAAYVSSLGVLLALFGWNDLILVIYGILFLLAPWITRLNNRIQAILVISLFCIGIFSQVVEVLAIAVIAEILSYFTLGIWLSKQRRGIIRRLGFLLFVTFIPFVLTVGVGLYTDDKLFPDSLEWWKLLLFCTSNIGILFLIIEGFRYATSRGRLVVLVAIGSMPLTSFIAHALYFVVLDRLVPESFTLVFLSAFLFLIILSLFASVLFRSGKRGPFEALLRKITSQKY